MHDVSLNTRHTHTQHIQISSNLGQKLIVQPLLRKDLHDDSPRCTALSHDEGAGWYEV